jgi:GntR family transcriptional repressor for pyruvate dehydrogenase complex
MFPQVMEHKLRRQTFDALVAHIVGSNLRPGHQLPSTAVLCEQFNASRSVVREALSALEAVGLVEISSGRNAVVRELDGQLIALFLARAIQDDERPLTSLMEVRAPLEIQAASLAAGRATNADVEGIRALLQAMESVLEDAVLYTRLDVSFHLAIARASRNSALIWFTESLRVKLAESMGRMRDYREMHHLVGQEHKEHLQIAQAIFSGDPTAARAAMERHMDSSMELVRLIGAEESTAIAPS